MSSEPAWMALARQELGVAAIPGPEDNDRVLRYFRDVGHGEIKHDEVAWCAAFAGACLERSGHRSTRSLMARSYLNWGVALDTPRQGCIVVLSRGVNRALGHVGFYAGTSGGNALLLGGNQSRKVSIAAFARSRVLGYRWPAGVANPGAASAPANKSNAENSVYDIALKHVLKMEGGWSNDPADPGGATNFGITIGDYARYRGIRLDSSSAPGLIAELRTIAQATVGAIYHQNYWLASRADLLPGAPALMHFDAAVNHGVAGAARMLQQAAGVTADGAIGPVTIAAVRGANQMALVARYADIRRAAYRRLRIFSRFGRGWLLRVDQTIAAARPLADITITWPEPTQPNEETSMTNEPKWWLQSLTVWGTIITGLSTVLPIIGPFVGINLSGALIVQFGDQITHVLQALGGVIGTIMAITGRFRASAPLQQSLFTFRL